MGHAGAKLWLLVMFLHANGHDRGMRVMGALTTVTNVTGLCARTAKSSVLAETQLAIDLVTSDGMPLHLFAWFSDETLAQEYAEAIQAVTDRRNAKDAA